MKIEKRNFKTLDLERIQLYARMFVTLNLVNKSDWNINCSGFVLLRVITTMPCSPTMASIYFSKEKKKYIEFTKLIKIQWLTSSSLHSFGVANDSNRSAPHNNFTWIFSPLYLVIFSGIQLGITPFKVPSFKMEFM